MDLFEKQRALAKEAGIKSHLRGIDLSFEIEILLFQGSEGRWKFRARDLEAEENITLRIGPENQMRKLYQKFKDHGFYLESKCSPLELNS